MDRPDVSLEEIPFTLGQKWAFAAPQGRYLFNLLESKEKANSEALIKTIEYMMLKHDMLRSRISYKLENWVQSVLPTVEPLPLVQISLRDVEEKEYAATILEVAKNNLKELDEYKGSLIRFIVFECKTGEPDLLLIIAHHLIFDYYSVVIFCYEFNIIYDKYKKGQNVLFGPKPPSFKAFSDKIIDFMNNKLLQEFRDYWSLLPWDLAKPFPSDYSEEYVAIHSGKTRHKMNFSLSSEETKNFMILGKNTTYQLIDVLLAAISITIAEWTHRNFTHIVSMDFGRMMFSHMLNENFTKTIGLLSINRRFVLDTSLIYREKMLLPAKKVIELFDKQIHEVPSNGITFDVLHRQCTDEHILGLIADHHVGHAVLLNYLGNSGSRKQSTKKGTWSQSNKIHIGDLYQWKSPRPVHYNEGSLYSPVDRAIIWVARLFDNQLYCTLEYDPGIHKPSTIEKIFKTFRKHINYISSHSS